MEAERKQKIDEVRKRYEHICSELSHKLNLSHTLRNLGNQIKCHYKQVNNWDTVAIDKFNKLCDQFDEELRKAS